LDNFSYSVYNGEQYLGSASITIKVGSVTIGNTVANTPPEAINDALNLICFSTDGAPSSPAMIDLCSAFLNVNPTTGELEAFAEELAPREVEAQNQVSSSIATQQIDNIRKRLAALRQGSNGIDTTRFTLNIGDEKPFSVASLMSDQEKADKVLPSGGGASGDPPPFGYEQPLGNYEQPVADYQQKSNWGLFFSGNVGGGKGDTTELADGFKFSTYGLNVGIDYSFGSKGFLGGAVGLATSGMDVDNDGGSVDVSGGSLIGYGSYFFTNQLYFESIIARYQNTFESKRNIQLPDGNGGTTTATAEGETDNGIFSFSLGLGYEFVNTGGFSLNLIGSADYIQSAFDGYAETGAGGANLLLSPREDDAIISTLNLQMAYAISLRSGVIIPQWDIAWKHDFSEDPSQVEGVFFNDPTNTLYSFDAEDPDSDYFKVNLGLSYLFPGGNTGFFSYDTTLGRDNFNDYNVTLGMRLEF